MPINYIVTGSIIGCCFLFCLLTALLSYLRLINKKQQGELAALRTKLDEKTEKINLFQDEKNRKKNFTDSLNNAAVTTRLQQPRLQLQGNNTPDTPDKYKYLANMVKSGMSADDVAGILDISAAEAGQLVTLARMSR